MKSSRARFSPIPCDPSSRPAPARGIGRSVALRPGLASLLACTLALGACVTSAEIQPYREPKDGDKARLRIISSERVTVTPGQSCINDEAIAGGTVLGFPVGGRSYKSRSLGMPAPDRIGASDFAEIEVRAGQPFTIAMRSTSTSPLICRVGVSFTPKQGEDYQAILMVDYDAKRCVATVESLNRPGQAVPQQQAPSC